MFERTEWLSRCQIQGFFSRLSASIKQGSQRRIELLSGGELDTDTEEEDDLAEEYACQLDEGQRNKGSCLGESRLDPPNLVRYLQSVHVCKRGEATNFQSQDA